MAYRTRRGESQFQARTRLARAMGFGSYREQRRATPGERLRARVHRPDPENLAWSVLAAMHLGLDEDDGYARFVAAGGRGEQLYAEIWEGMLSFTTDVERADWWAFGYRTRPPARLATRWRRGPRGQRWGWRVEVWTRDQMGRVDRHHFMDFGRLLHAARGACLKGMEQYEDARLADPTKYGPTVGAVPVALYKITRR